MIELCPLSKGRGNIVRVMSPIKGEGGILLLVQIPSVLVLIQVVILK